MHFFGAIIKIHNDTYQVTAEAIKENMMDNGITNVHSINMCGRRFSFFHYTVVRRSYQNG